MLYRIITVIGALVFVIALFALIWFFCRKFLEHHGVTDQVSDRATVLATWTFARRQCRFGVRSGGGPSCSALGRSTGPARA